MPDPNRSLSMEHTLEMKKNKMSESQEHGARNVTVRVQRSVFCSHISNQKCEQFWPTCPKQEVKN